MLGIESFPADAAGYEELLGWLAGFGAVTLVGMEGTGWWGWRVPDRGVSGWPGSSTNYEVEMVEADRPNRQKRRE